MLISSRLCRQYDTSSGSVNRSSIRCTTKLAAGSNARSKRFSLKYLEKRERMVSSETVRAIVSNIRLPT